MGGQSEPCYSEITIIRRETAVAADIETIQALRADTALQIARYIRAKGFNQTTAARHLKLPQPIVSKIMTGRVTELSLELLIRAAVRANLPMTLQTGVIPAEAGVFVAVKGPSEARPNPSALGEAARRDADRAFQRLSLPERLAAFVEHNQLLHDLQAASRKAEVQRVQKLKKSS